MVCKNHMNRQAYNSCSQCGDYICDECNVVVNGQSVCKTCASEMIEPKASSGSKYSSMKSSSSFLLFMFSALPGLNYMYLGLIKRGIFVMMSFFVVCGFAAYLENALLLFAIPVIFFASFFDGFRIKNIMSRGTPVEDTFDDITCVLTKYKFHILAILIVFIGLDLLSSFRYMFNYDWPFYGLFSKLFKLALSFGLIIIGFSFLRKKSPKDSKKSDDIIDKRNI